MCREGGEASISLRVHAPISGLFPLSPGSPVYFHQPELAGCFFLRSLERPFLLLETLGMGVSCCNLCRSRSVFKKGEGTWRTPPAPGLS